MMVTPPVPGLDERSSFIGMFMVVPQVWATQ